MRRLEATLCAMSTRRLPKRAVAGLCLLAWLLPGVAALVAEGLSNAAIARRLTMTESSVKTYVSRILTKLGCENRVQAALLVRDAGHQGPAVPDEGGDAGGTRR